MTVNRQLRERQSLAIAVIRWLQRLHSKFKAQFEAQFALMRANGLLITKCCSSASVALHSGSIPLRLLSKT
jgi:hypothetical protein